MASVVRCLMKAVVRQAFKPASRVLGSNLGRVLIGSGVIYNFTEPEIPRLENPITFPKLDRLAPDFLIRQASAASAEQAGTIATFAILTLEECVKDLQAHISELSNLYDASMVTGFALTDKGHQRVVELQEQIGLCRREVSDLEILFHYVKKLLEANAEVAFATGAEFVSTQTSDRLHSTSQHVAKLIDEVRTLERDLIKIQQRHIEFVGKIVKENEASD